MKNLEELKLKMDMNKEILDSFPKNNTKNKKIYISKIEELKKEHEEYQKEIIEEIDRRYKKISNIKEKSEIEISRQKVERDAGVLYLLNEIDTSYEKMDLDRALFNLNHYYKKRLEIVNETILYCIKKFEEVGVELNLKDFNYSEYVTEYLKPFFGEMESEDVNSKRIKNKFDEIYWKCPELIIHIVLNIKYLYEKNEKKIDKYYARQKEKLIRNFNAKDIMERHMELKRQLDKVVDEDKSSVINDFLSGKLNIKDYNDMAITERYARFIPKEQINLKDDAKMNEIDANLEKLANSLYEYKKYLKFKFIIDNVKKIYIDKDKYKNIYSKTKKIIHKQEKKRMSYNKKINKKGLFKKSNEKYIDKRNSLIIELKKLYKELGENKVYNKIATEINNNSTLIDALKLASSFYRYLFMSICENYKEIEETEVEKIIDDLREFVNYPYSTIINNAKILDDKDIMIIIKDRYQLLGINISKEDLSEENLDTLIDTINKIKITHNIRKNKINLEEISSACEFKKILNK